MDNAVLIYTFSPVQGFISEARRTADLFNGSRILIRLAQAVTGAMQAAGCDLVYPLPSGGGKAAPDAPNRAVAIVRWDEVDAAIKQIEAAFQKEWASVCREAIREIGGKGLDTLNDPAWKAIWERQVGRYWEAYWAAAKIAGGDYTQGYRDAIRALESAKRQRAFEPNTEVGAKDSLSGARQALRTEKLDAREYWSEFTRPGRFFPSRIYAGGRERLDALGAVKRFCPADGATFPSTSSVASADFLEAVKQDPKAANALAGYRKGLESALGDCLFPTSRDEAWPYDGDFLYEETLTARRLKESYGAEPDAKTLEVLRASLKQLTETAGNKPALYYAILNLDGDRIGEHIAHLLKGDDPLAAHQAFSQALSAFALSVPGIIAAHLGHCVYSGGDDLLALLPLSRAMAAYLEAAQTFKEATGCSASAGMAVVHHTAPLSPALREARQALVGAKEIDGRDALRVHYLKRSGEGRILQSRRDWIRSTGSQGADIFSHLAGLFRSGYLAAGLIRDVEAASYALPDSNGAFRSELGRLLYRHASPGRRKRSETDALADDLCRWTDLMGTAGLAGWMHLADLCASGVQP